MAPIRECTAAIKDVVSHQHITTCELMDRYDLDQQQAEEIIQGYDNLLDRSVDHPVMATLTISAEAARQLNRDMHYLLKIAERFGFDARPNDQRTAHRMHIIDQLNDGGYHE
jgi:hypothetical protein